MHKRSLFFKFVWVILLVGLFPMTLVVTFISNYMRTSYESALRNNYEQAVTYSVFSVENMLNSYDGILKTMYQFNLGNEWYGSFMGGADNLRKVIQGESYDSYDPDKLYINRKNDMEKIFLKNVQGIDSYIAAAHFVGYDADGNQVDFHYSALSSFFQDEDLFLDSVHWSKVDQQSKKLQIIPPHKNSYYYQRNNDVITFARNYYDMRGDIGCDKYIGTLFIDVDTERLNLLFSKLNISGKEDYCIIDDDDNILYESNQGIYDFSNIKSLQETDKNTLIIDKVSSKYGLKVYVAIDKGSAYQKINDLQKMMYVIIGSAIIALIIASILFSRRLTKPISLIVKQTSQIESGNFDIHIPVKSNDEVSVLVERFNQMSVALKQYINKYYVSQIKQNEAELTALRSQIYPHFLYNTLEIIRMNALDYGDQKVSNMIEALSKQIHYLIAPMKDMVPISKEIDNIKDYVYLLNCRIEDKVCLSISGIPYDHIFIPRLILQPIVENAYVHGIKHKQGIGNINIDIGKTDNGDIEISVMDNGVGIDENELKRISELLNSNAIGIRNEYNWQSIGMKNVHDRIRYLYGESYGVHLTSKPGVGTMVRFNMPLIEKGENRNDKNDIS